MIKTKGNNNVTIGGKKLEHLKDEDLKDISEKVLKDEKLKLEIKIKENLENKEHKEF